MKNIEIKAFAGELPVESLYTAGIAGERFFRSLKEEGTLLATYCPKCELLLLPPKIYCENCFEELREWRKVKNEGILKSYTILHIGPDGKRKEIPEIVGMIKMKDTTTVLIHRLGNVKEEELEIGMRVEAVFKPEKERKGDINDILYFQPIRKG